MPRENKLLLVLVSALTIVNGSSATEYDFDGDGLADVAFRRIVDGAQYILNSSGSNYNSAEMNGIQRIDLGEEEGDIPVLGDFDGDGIWDVGIRRPETFEWIIRYSSTEQLHTFVFGRDINDIPVPADYDGDGTTDLAVRRPATKTWYIKNSGGFDPLSHHEDGISRVVFGHQQEDIPMVADYDGDGKVDIAVRRPSTHYWYILNSSGIDELTGNNDGISRLRFGRSAYYTLAPADYTGDGKADLAAIGYSEQLRGAVWYINNSDGSNLNSSREDGIQRIHTEAWGTDVPVVADYDGDGMADIAWRNFRTRSTYVRLSSEQSESSETNSKFAEIAFGSEVSDLPLHNLALHGVRLGFFPFNPQGIIADLVNVRNTNFDSSLTSLFGTLVYEVNALLFDTELGPLTCGYWDDQSFFNAYEPVLPEETDGLYRYTLPDADFAAPSFNNKGILVNCAIDTAIAPDLDMKTIEFNLIKVEVTTQAFEQESLLLNLKPFQILARRRF